ncbi:MAG TPA: hypothetical protein VF399_08920 [bacterium]|jgi:hypothetical protein
MYEQLNEFKYTAQTKKTYIIYFLKFWRDEEKNDYIAKYQIRSQDRDIVWYGRISKERALIDLNINAKDAKSMDTKELESKIVVHLKKLIVTVMFKGLDKGFEEPNTELVFYKEPLVAKRIWSG